MITIQLNNRNVFKKKKKVYIGLYQIPPPPPPPKKNGVARVSVSVPKI